VTDPRNNLAFWFPRLLAAGLPVPRTEIVRMPDDVAEASWAILDGEELNAWIYDHLMPAVERIGLPAFLRTGHTAAKHEWSRTCALTDLERLRHHVGALIEYSACAGIFGLPWDAWAVREMLPTVPLATLPNYGDMPLCREWRCFVRGGDLVCRHPYWPAGPIAAGISVEDAPWLEDAPRAAERLAAELATEDGIGEVEALARRAGAAVGGEWSVDVLATERGWYVTDMAVARESWHWPGCPNEEWR
jgi:hypothetical protein